MSYLDDLLSALSTFQTKLLERWQQTMADSVRAMEYWTPPPVHFRQNYNRSPEVWEYRKPEVQAHLTYGCEALEWFDGGAKGVVPACHGKIRDPGSPDNMTVWWQGANIPVDQDEIECGIPGLFSQVEGWAYEDRSYVFDICPLFPQGRLDDLKEARKHLLTMAGELGGDFSVEGADPDFQQDITLAEDVDYLFGNRGEEQDWRADWTGTAADRISEGFFSSTKPTLHNHARIANGLATMINERAKIIDTYQKNTIKLVESATAALGAKTDGGSTDHTAKWQTVQAIGMVGAVAPPSAFVGAGFILVGWLGEKFLGIDNHAPTFTHHPGEVATNLHEAVLKMLEDLNTSEDEYRRDTTEFRQDLNSVSSTFLELYDITQNSPTGKH
ncbi:hypothetical protein [Actinophytocola sediminis]